MSVKRELTVIHPKRTDNSCCFVLLPNIGYVIKCLRTKILLYEMMNSLSEIIVFLLIFDFYRIVVVAGGLLSNLIIKIENAFQSLAAFVKYVYLLFISVGFSLSLFRAPG